jgi:hypothetical protein
VPTEQGSCHSSYVMCGRAQTSVVALHETATMSDAWLRRMVMLAIVLLVLHAVGTWTYAALGPAAAIVSAVLVGAVSIFSARMAGLGEGNNTWFIVPTVVFTALPLGARLWTLIATEQGWWTSTVEFGPFVIGFAAPVLLLLMAYLELGRRAAPVVQRLSAAPDGVTPATGGFAPLSSSSPRSPL